MSTSYHHIKEQKEVIFTMGQSLFYSLAPFLKKAKNLPALPSKFYKETISPRSQELVDEYISHVGGSIDAYQSILPWHFYPQWATPLIGKAMKGVPFNLTRILNAGCSVTINHQIPRNTELFLKCHLKEIVQDEKKILITTEVITETAEQKNALVVEQHTIIPQNTSTKSSKKNKNCIPYEAKKIGTLNIGRKAGLDFALLTGDFNPIHWAPLYAKTMGFASTINHGFSTMARALEVLNFELFHGSVVQLNHVEMKFTRPLGFPAKVHVFVAEKQFFVGHGIGGQPYLIGSFQQKEQ